MNTTMEEAQCTRCGYLENLESHHIKHKADGGSDEPSNRRYLCQGCHDYQHAKETVLKAIAQEEERIKVLKKRLELIEKENSPDQIHQRGYQSYWDLYDEVLPPPTKCITAASGEIYDATEEGSDKNDSH